MNRKTIILLIGMTATAFLVGYLIGLSSGADLCARIAAKTAHMLNVTIDDKLIKVYLSRGL